MSSAHGENQQSVMHTLAVQPGHSVGATVILVMQLQKAL